MEFSIRDSIQNERGQGIIEYVLLLVVIVAMVLGGIYQLNSAFKVWANNYFGEYLACILETGELPTISGSPGDSEICNQMFKAFSLADGRPLKTGAGQNTGDDGGGAAGGSKEDRRTGSDGSTGNYSKVTGRSGNFFSSSKGGGRFSKFGKGGENLGKTGEKGGAGDYGGGYSRLNRRINTGVRYRLDNRFAFSKTSTDNKSEGRMISSVKVSDKSEKQKKSILRLNSDALNKDTEGGPESEMSFGNFIRILIIAAIVIALVMVIGGQVLQIGKSMD